MNVVMVSTPFLVSYVALWILMLVLAAAVLAMYQHLASRFVATREGRQAQGPSQGERMAEVQVEIVGGGKVRLPEPGRPAVLAFAATDCEICDERKSDFRRFAQSQGVAELVVICAGKSADAINDWAQDLSGITVISDVGARLATQLNVAFTPFAVAIDRLGVVRAKGLLNDFDSIAAYANHANTTQLSAGAA